MNSRFFKDLPPYLIWIAGLLCLGGAYPIVHAMRQQAPALQDSPYLRIDPEKIVTSDRDSRVPCGECHTLEYDAWRTTPHATGFDLLHRSEQAQEILDNMGFRLSKRESLCLRCHYTAVIRNDQARAIAGVSCESCHGAARDWVNVHNDYGGADRDTEDATHQQQRIAQSVAGGMLRPSDDVYAVAANCFECHTVPNERLINVGGHPSGSAFELIDWSDEIRHNFLQAQWSNDETNRPKTPARKRLMYVVGSALNYEYSIRAAAEATEQGRYAKAMERRVKVARRNLEKVYRASPIPAVQSILARGQDLSIGPNNKAALLAAADAMSTLTQQFARENDGAALAALDPLIAGEAPAPPEDDPTEDDPPEGGDPTTPDDPATPDDSAVVATPGGNTGPGETPTVDSTVAPDVNRVAVVGTKRRRPAWFAASQYETLGPSAGCSCHNDQFDWWESDQHSQSADPLLRYAPKAVEIATTYGLTLSQMVRGNQICMNCHGTVVTGEEAEEVFDGVSCENCHGPGGSYERKHQPPKPPPPSWSGYTRAASLGMINQEDPATRADNCVRCHHITDERLISSGHPTGEGFDMAERNRSIRHWDDPVHGAGVLNAAYQQAASRRPIPQNVTIATPPVIVTSRTGGNTPSTTTDETGDTGEVVVVIPPPRTRPLRTRPRGRSGPTLSVPLNLGPLPAVSDSTSTEDILLIIKQRLEMVYKALGRGPRDG